MPPNPDLVVVIEKNVLEERKQQLRDDDLVLTFTVYVKTFDTDPLILAAQLTSEVAAMGMQFDVSATYKGKPL